MYDIDLYSIQKPQNMSDNNGMLGPVYLNKQQFGPQDQSRKIAWAFLGCVFVSRSHHTPPSTYSSLSASFLMTGQRERIFSFKLGTVVPEPRWVIRTGIAYRFIDTSCACAPPVAISWMRCVKGVPAVKGYG